MKNLTNEEKSLIKKICIMFHSSHIICDEITYKTPESWQEEWEYKNG